uniref:choice-of-anchor L domain-containing protein n=1 Tax=uncultured Dokdonia sp. TaxID=575653 RepID=UPI0026276623
MRSSLVLISVLFLFFTVHINAQAITVDGSATTVADVETLITDILIGSSSDCAEISNVSKSTGIDEGAGINGIGSFESNGADFPYEAGIVLVSGNVNNVPGPEVDGIPSGGGWGGDTDLEANTTATNTNDASFIQFDFTPFVDELNFNFIMASEEYNQGFECTFSDAFAFILTDLTTGVVQNLAVLPGTNIPIEVTNIRPEVPGNCAAVNEEFFDRYNFAPFNPEANSAINFQGQTVSLTAMGTVVVGNPYTIKLVVADQSDSVRDIAVFLEAGSFNLGVDIGGDRIGSEFNAACEGETLTLDATFDGAISYTWEVDNGTGFVPLLDGMGVPVTTPTIDVTVAATYRVLVDAGTGCLGEDTATIEFANPMYNDPMDLTVCDDISGDGVEVFDLTDQTSDILDTQDPTVVSVTFYENQSDAEMNINQIPNPDAYSNTMSSQEIWVRVETDLSPDCFEVGSFMISVNSQTIANDPGVFTVCDDASDGSDTNGITVFDLSSLNNSILGTQDPTLFSVSYHSSAIDATNNDMPLPLAYTSTDDMIWVRVENNGDVNCFAIREITLDVAELPVLLNNPVLLSQCDTDQDGFAFINLTEAQTLLSADANNETFLYFDSGGSPIIDPTSYVNQTANNESVSVTISTVNGCTRQAQIDLEVDTSEIPDTFQLEYFECDTDSDGQSVFDFSDATAQVLALFPAGQMLTVSYYETQQEAETETNPITATIDAYTNNLTYTDANGQQGIWVRVDGDTANDCRGLGIHVLLNVEANPTFLPNISSLEECSPIANAAQFDLTENDAEITGGDSNILV